MAKGKKRNQDDVKAFVPQGKIQIPECGFYNLREKMTDEQLTYADSIVNNTITFVNALAGTGKTTVAVACMKYLYDLHLINKFVYVFSCVEEKTLGFRPGTADEKESDYLAPLFDALIEIDEVPEKALDEKYGWVQTMSHTFLRGANLKGCGVLIDEFQNFTRKEAKKTLTRIHDNCHVVIAGHVGQIDLPKVSMSGFEPMMELFKEEIGKHPVGFCELTKNFRGWVSTTADKLELF